MAQVTADNKDNLPKRSWNCDDTCAVLVTNSSIACYKNGPRLDAEMRNKIATSLEEILWEENVSSVNQNYMGQIFRHSYAESGRIHGMKD